MELSDPGSIDACGEKTLHAVLKGCAKTDTNCTQPKITTSDPNFFTWWSRDDRYAKFSNDNEGRVTGLRAGEARVCAFAVDKRYFDCGLLQVNPPGYVSVSSDKTDLLLNETAQLHAEVRSVPGGPVLYCEDNSVEWRTYPEGRVGVTAAADPRNAVATAVDYGDTDVTATVMSTTSPPLPIHVLRPKQVQIAAASNEIFVGQSLPLTAQVVFDNGTVRTDMPVSWSIASGTSISLSPGGATASVSGEQPGPAKVQATLTEPPDVVPGYWDVTVKSRLKVTAISPGSTTECQTASVTITGTGFMAGAQVGFEGGGGSIAAQGVTVVGDTTITARTDSAMKLGTYDVRVTVGGETASLPQAFSVTACRSYSVSWTLVGSRDVQYSIPDGTRKEVMSMSWVGGVEIQYAAGGAKSVKPASSGYAGYFREDDREDRHFEGGCGGSANGWSLPGNRWSELHHRQEFVPTSEFLASLSGLELTEASDGTLGFSFVGTNLGNTSTYQWHEIAGGDDCRDFSDVDHGGSLVGEFNPGIGYCGIGNPTFFLVPQGDGSTFVASATREAEGMGSFSCNVTAVKK